MIVIVRIEVDDETRRSLNRQVGKPGLASRAEVVRRVRMCFEADIADTCDELRTGRNPDKEADRG